jgi:hypothetical protein
MRSLRFLFVPLLAATLVLSAAGPARAGLLKRSIDFFQITPFVGGEVARVGFTSIDTTGKVTSGDFLGAGLAWGALAGFRLALINLGVLYQRTDFMKDPTDQSIVFNKLYAQLGFNFPIRILVIVLHFDFGWAFLDYKDAPNQQGFGGKVGLAFDFYPHRVVSLGVGADFDGQGFMTPSGLVGTYGGTFTFRTGFHF